MGKINRPSKAKPVEAKPKEVQAPKKIDPNLLKLIDTVNKKFGENALVLGVPKDDNGNYKKIERISTGNLTLDIALGGGIPVGFFTELSGAYSCTKTTILLKTIAEAQKSGRVCAFIDVEGTSDADFREANGIDNETLLYCKPDSLEEATQLALDLQRSGIVSFIGLDSIAALVPNKVQESGMDETVRMGITQQLLGEFFGKYTANNNRLSREGREMCTIMCANQLREKIGAYGDPEYTPGGRAKGFYCCVDIRVRRGDWVAEGSGDNREIVGQIVKFKVEKNKTFKRMQTGEYDYYFAENSAGIPVFGYDSAKEIILLSVEWGVVERRGNWFYVKGEKYQGVSALTEALKQDPELIQELKEEILELVRNK